MLRKPLNDDERQAYIDSLPKDQINPKAKQTFDEAIERAAQPKRSKPEKQVGDGSYNDKQTHSHKTEDTSD
jgi:hypothetical protein